MPLPLEDRSGYRRQLHWPAVMPEASEAPHLEADERPERGTRATKRLRRQGFVPGVVYGGGGNGDSTSFKVQARVLRGAGGRLGADRSRGLGPVRAPGDRQGPAASPGAGRGRSYRPARGAHGREDRDTGGRARPGHRGGARREGGRRARPGHARAQHRGPADRYPRGHRGRRVGDADRRHDAPLRAGPARRRDLPRRPRRDDHRHHRRAHRGRGARGDRGRDRARRRGAAGRGAAGRGGEGEGEAEAGEGEES